MDNWGPVPTSEAPDDVSVIAYYCTACRGLHDDGKNVKSGKLSAKI